MPPHLDVLNEPESTVTIPVADDGLGGWRHRVPPGKSVTGPDPAQGGGQYWVVLAGTDVAEAVPYAALACVFVGPDEPARTATAGPEGLDVLILQYPRWEN
jgi:hypothetical protein